MPTEALTLSPRSGQIIAPINSKRYSPNNTTIVNFISKYGTMIYCLFGVYRPTWEFFTHLETSMKF